MFEDDDELENLGSEEETDEQEGENDDHEDDDNEEGWVRDGEE